MGKGKILGLKNTYDSMWYEFEASQRTYDLLNNVFFFCRNEGYESFDEMNVMVEVKKAEISSIYSNSDHLFYLILEENYFHLILRKTLNWEKFEFIESKH